MWGRGCAVSGYGVGVSSTVSSLSGYLPKIGGDVLIIVGAFVAMGLGVALFRKGLQWFRKTVS